MDTKLIDGVAYRYARASDSLEIASLYDRVYQGGYPIKECTNPDSVEEIIKQGKHIWIVALDENEKIIGATVSKPDYWNRTYETCRSVTDSSLGSKGIGFNLYNLSLREALLRDDCDLTYGYPRNAKMKRLMEKPNPPITVIGTDFGMHLVSDQREMHLWSLVNNPNKRVNRIIEEDSLFLKSAELERIIEPLGFKSEFGIYPKDLVVGPIGTESHESAFGTVEYNYFDPSKCASITSIKSKNDEDAVSAVWSFIDSHDYFSHVSMFILADKKDLFFRLQKPRNLKKFNLSAYLPAWYYNDGNRYDCLNMALRIDDRVPKIYEIDELVKSFDKVYNSFEQSLDL